MRDNIVALVSAGASAAGERVLKDGGDKAAVARAVMQDAHNNWLAPDEDEAFMGAVSALWRLYPDDQALRDETKAIGDRNKVLSALMNGVPVDMEALDLQEMPGDALGLMDLWRETARAQEGANR